MLTDTNAPKVVNFYPRPPRGGRRVRLSHEVLDMDISIHALREEGDICITYNMVHLFKFLSTPSARRATGSDPASGRTVDISIHALREEGDCSCCWVQCQRRKFLSTPSARRATRIARTLRDAPGISIHALREEGDFVMMETISATMDFYPRPPRGGRLSRCGPIVGEKKLFLSTPSARRATATSSPSWRMNQISIHALREEGDGKTPLPLIF